MISLQGFLWFPDNVLNPTEISGFLFQMVIGTDMCHHFENLTEFQTNFELSSNMREWSCTLPALKLLMHASG